MQTYGNDIFLFSFLPLQGNVWGDGLVDCQETGPCSALRDAIGSGGQRSPPHKAQKSGTSRETIAALLPPLKRGRSLPDERN